MGKKTLSKAFHLFEKFKIPPETQTELPELKGTHARDFMVRFSQFFGIIQ